MTFQARFTTKLKDLTVGDPVIELNTNVDKEHLNQIVKSFLIKNETADSLRVEELNFDFIVGDRLLQLPVANHLELYSDELDARSILSEKLVDVEYFLSLDPPKPEKALPHEDWVSCVDANETHMISGSYDNSIRIFSFGLKECLTTIENAHEKPITRVHWLKNHVGLKRNELAFVSCGHDEVAILRKFNTQTFQVSTIGIYKGHTRSVNCVDSHDDIIATGSFDKSLRLWSTHAKEKSILTLTGHQESITGLRWLESCNEFNTIATCSLDRTICFWDIEVGECKRRLLSSKPLLSIDYCEVKRLILAASCDRHVRVYDARAPDNATAKAAYTSHNAWISSVAFGPTSSYNFISGGYDNLVKLWDLRSTKACLYDLIGHNDKVLDVNWTNSSYVLSGSADSTLKVFASKSSS